MFAISQTPNLINKRLDLSNELKGFYIHRKLVNFLCFHVNLKYAIKVSEIMDIIDEKIKLNNSKLENEIDILKTLAVPTCTNDKKLRIMKVDENIYKISGDSTRTKGQFPHPVIKTYIFASSMNIRQQLKENKVVTRSLYFNDLQAFDKYIHDNYTVLKEY